MELPLYAEIAAVVLVLFYIMAIVSAVEAILTTRTSQGAVAWTISLLTFPLITVPLYLVFGRNKFDGYLEKRNEIEEQSLRLIQQTSGAIEDHIVPVSRDTPLYTSLLNLARMPATTGNTGGAADQRPADLRQYPVAACSRPKNISCSSFISSATTTWAGAWAGFWSDKAKAGVKVFLLYDEIGSRPFTRSRLYRQLQMTGVHVAPFNTTQGRRNRFQLNFRNHRKVVVVDGKYAWIGGHNVGDEYLGLSKSIRPLARYPHPLPGSRGAGRRAGLRHRLALGHTLAPENRLGFHGDRKGDSTVLVFPSDPASEYEEAGLMYHQAISAARERIWIASPYFVPDQGIISALQLAALRGVDVRVIIPDEPDKRVVGYGQLVFHQGFTARRRARFSATRAVSCTRRCFSWITKSPASARQISITALSA